MAVTTFNMSGKMDKTLEELKEHFGASSKAEVLRKAVALLKIATESEAPDGSIIIRKGGEEQKIIIK